MKQLFRQFRHEEGVILFDNGLRVESELRILSSGRWQRRYMVCQRRSLSEAPLVGIFKSDVARENGEYLDLFYLQNYVGYEWGFKCKGTKKTLAILMQGDTLVLAFRKVESMMFWKEWLKDVCGRSALFFIQIQAVPQDFPTLLLSSPDIRLHVNRVAMLIVQEVPPQQKLHLHLEDMFDVQCSESLLSFRVRQQPSTPFVFAGDGLNALSLRLRLLLAANQFANYVRWGATVVGDTAHMEAGPSAVMGGRSVSCVTPPLIHSHHHQQLSSHEANHFEVDGSLGNSPGRTYENYSASTSCSPKMSLPSNITLAVATTPHTMHLLSAGMSPRELLTTPPSVNAAASNLPEEEEPEEPYADPEIDMGDAASSPAVFMNPTMATLQQNIHTYTQESHSNRVREPPPPIGLVKPNWPIMTNYGQVIDGTVGVGSSSLSRKLRKSLSGPFSRYDGERGVGAQKEADVDDRESDDTAFTGRGNKNSSLNSPFLPPDRPDPTPHPTAMMLNVDNEPEPDTTSNATHTKRGGWRSRITATLSAPLQGCQTVTKPSSKEASEARGNPLSKDTATHASTPSHLLNFRIDTAIARGRERLKQSLRKSSNPTSSSHTTTASCDGSSQQLASSFASCDTPTSSVQTPTRRKPKPPAPPPQSMAQPMQLTVVDVHGENQEKDEEGTSLYANEPIGRVSCATSISTLAAKGNNVTKGTGENRQPHANKYAEVGVHLHQAVGDQQQHDDEETSCNDKAITKLRRADGSELSLASSISIHSELNARVQFQRNGRGRSSGSSSKASRNKNGTRKRSASPCQAPQMPQRGPPPAPQQIQSQPMLTSLVPNQLDASSQRGEEGTQAELCLPAEYAEIDETTMALVFAPIHPQPLTRKRSVDVLLRPLEKKGSMSAGSHRFPAGLGPEVDYVTIDHSSFTMSSQQAAMFQDDSRSIDQGSIDAARGNEGPSHASSGTTLDTHSRVQNITWTSRQCR